MSDKHLVLVTGAAGTYLEATVTAAAAALAQGDLEVFVNISQMTVSQMSLKNMTEARRGARFE